LPGSWGGGGKEGLRQSLHSPNNLGWGPVSVHCDVDYRREVTSPLLHLDDSTNLKETKRRLGSNAAFPSRRRSRVHIHLVVKPVVMVCGLYRGVPQIWSTVAPGEEGMTLQQVNEMEREFLRKLDHHLFIAPRWGEGNWMMI
jgi:hypothetical protein